MNRPYYNGTIRVAAVILFLMLCLYFVNAEVITTSLTIVNVIEPIDGQCIQNVCSEVINGTRYVTW